MSLKDAAMRAAVLETLHVAIGEELKAAKAERDAGMKAAKAETGTRQIGAELPDGTAIARVTLVSPDPVAVVADEQAFAAWVREHRPDQIRREFVTTVRETYVKALLAEMTAAGVPQWCDQDTGEVHTVPGIRMQPRAAYARTTWEKQGKERVAEAWQSGQLTHLTMPQLTTGDSE